MIGKSDGIFGYRVDRRKDGEGEPWIVITDYKGRDSEVHAVSYTHLTLPTILLV